MSISVVLADDQQLIRAGLGRLLDSEPDLNVVGQAGHSASAVDLVRRVRPQVALLDIRMPTMAGIEATRRIVGACDTRVVILTTFDLDEYVYASLRAGASGFILKDAPTDHMLHAIRAAADGHALIDPAVTRRLIGEFVRRPAPDAAKEALRLLTDRERDVFAGLARGLSNAEIATQLFLGEATIKTHVGNVLTKLRLRDRIQTVIYAYENGLVTPGADNE